VERLKEERERSISGEANPPAVKEDDDEEEPPAGKGSLEEDDAGVGEDRVSGGESGRSCKESNSSDLKRPRPADDAGGTADAGDGDAAVRGEDEVAGDDAARESSAVKREQASGESVVGSKGTAPVDAEKESSDVQSSASPSRRREPEIAAGEDAEAEEASAPPPAAAVLPAAEAEALRAFLESVRTSKPGSVFERRLESQVKNKSSSVPLFFLSLNLNTHSKL